MSPSSPHSRPRPRRRPGAALCARASRPFPALLLAALAALFSAAPAKADVAQARELFLRGQKALEAGQAKEALAAFEAAYASARAPSLLFYLAEAHRQGGEMGKALALYQEYLQKLPAAPKRVDAEARLAELKKAAASNQKEVRRTVELDDFDIGVPAVAPAAPPKKAEAVEPSSEAKANAEKANAARAEVKAKAKAAKEARAAEAEQKRAAQAQSADRQAAADKAAAETLAAAALAATSTPTAAVPAEHAVVAEPKPSSESKAAFDPKAASPSATAPVAAPAAEKKPLPPAPAGAVAARPPSSSAMKAAAWVFGAVGVAALATGGLFGLQAHNASTDLTQASRAGLALDPAVEERGKRAQALQYVCLGAGGAALLGSGLLALFAPAQSAARAEVLPVALPGGAMASFGVHY